MNLTFLSDLMDSVLERGRHLIGISSTDARHGVEELVGLARDLLSSRGEASGVALADEILSAFGRLAPDDRRAFLCRLASDFGPEPEAVAAALAAYEADPSPAAVGRLHRASEPRRQELFRRMNLAPDGTLRLVRMREDILKSLPDEPALGVVDDDFRHLFSSWFNRGFLMLRSIDWTTPANILEKIIAYEAVHAIESWDDLRARLAPPDRHCFAFFHPQMVDEPLVFVEVALTSDIPTAIADLLAEDRPVIDPASATTAVFYSISNCQDGLRGVSFGHFLIKQVVQELSRLNPGLKRFVTLSPAPGFAGWLRREREDAASRVLTEADREVLAALDVPGWHEDRALAQAIRAPLLAAASHYFVRAKGRGGQPVDPVARFHLGNGARLERLDPLGDVSAKGLRQSHGLMVNYLYEIAEIERNHEAYANGMAVAVSDQVLKTLRKEQLPAIADKTRKKA